MNGKILSFCAFLCFSFSAFAQKGFMHPKEQVDFVKSNIRRQQEPYLSAYRQLIEASDKALSEPHHALADFSVPGYYQKPEEHRSNSKSLATDAFNAYACALAYRLSGKKDYGKNACMLLNTWAKVNKKYSEADGPLVMSYAGTAMIMAAQLMSSEKLWNKADRAVFDRWVTDVYRKACNEIRNRKNNWADWGRFGSVLCAGYLGDATEMSENIRLIKSDLFHKIAPDGSMPEETRREKNGIWYTYFSLAPITAACWVVYNDCGENLFSLESNGASLKTALDYLFYYNRHPDEWKWYKDPNTGSPHLWPGNLLEAMTGIYRDESYDAFVKPDRPLMYPVHHFAWTFPTLMPLSLNGYPKN